MNTPPDHTLVTAEDPPAASAAAAAAPPVGLLRGWETHATPRGWETHATATHQASIDSVIATASATAAPPAGFSPPLAPSVRVASDDEIPSRSYPVARSIVTLVRGAVDAVAEHINDQLHITTTTTTPQPARNLTSDGGVDPPRHHHTAIDCLSIRSEGGIPTSSIGVDGTSLATAATTTAAAEATTANGVAALLPHIAADSVRSVPAMERGDELLDDQFVLIDGDLVALPPITPNEQEREGLEEYQRGQDFLSRKSCQPKPMRKGLRGARNHLRKLVKRKLFKRKEKDDKSNVRKNRRDQQQDDPNLGISPNASQCEGCSTSATTENNSCPEKRSPEKRGPRNKSPMRGWKMKRDKREKEAIKEEHKKKRRSWRNKQMIPEDKILDNESAVVSSQLARPAPARQHENDPSQVHPHLSLVHHQQLQQQQQQHDMQQVAQQQQQRQQPIYSQDPATGVAAYECGDPLAPPAAAYACAEDPLVAPAAPASAAAYSYESVAALSQHHHPPQPPAMSGPPTQQDSVHASFVGNVDQVMAAGGILDAAACAEAYVDESTYWTDKKEDEPSFSVLPPDADYKVDKLDAPDVEYMLRRAEQETVNDVLERESDEDPRISRTNNKTTGMSCPLSTAKVTDEVVHNDVLKVVMVGAPGCDKSGLARAIRQSSKKPKRRTTLGVDVHTWVPDTGPGQELRFSIWDVQGASQQLNSDTNFGANPGIQSLFFSSNGLYLLVWDLGANNTKTYGRDFLLDQLEREEEEEDDDDEDDDDEEDNQFVFEEAKRQADLVLQADIEKRVLSWIDCIARRGPGSSILPVAVIPEHMAAAEAKRRCDIMQNLLEHHIGRYENDPSTPKLLVGMGGILCVSLANGSGLHELQETLVAIASDDSVFDHVGTTVPNATVKVLEIVRCLKQEGRKLVRVEHLMTTELGKHILHNDEITNALHFLASIGEVLYFGNDHDELLSRYIILSRKWFVSALSCILRNDLKRELSETRRFMNMQCIYSNQQFPECPAIQSITGGSASTCPLLSSTDTNMLWLSMQFMREAADRSSQLSESSTTSSTMFGFLERLLVQSGVLRPIFASQSMDDAEVFFVPCLMAERTDSSDVWTFKSSEGWMTTLCHSWLFRDGAQHDLMEHITVGLVRDLYEFSRTFHSVDNSNPPHRTQSFPLVRSGQSDFLQVHDSDQIGRTKIHQIMCWQSSFLVKIGCIFADPDGDLKESFVEVFVTLVDQSSSHCVASDAMRATMQRLVVSGKGQAGSHGAKLWKGGFEVVMRSIQSTLGDFSNVDRQVVCPECLSHSQPRFASTWSWDSVKAAAESGSSIVRCIRGHRVDSNLICGTTKRQEMSLVHEQPFRSVKAVADLLHSVVLVGLWDTESKEVRNVGSGFIADKRLGLIVTAGHVLFNMQEGASFGTPYFGYKSAKVVIGVIPDGGHNAVYRYFAEIIADDISGVDACIVRLTSKIANDIDGDLMEQPDDALVGNPLNLEAIHQESLRSLKLTTRFELEESVRILGFNQGGEGLVEQGKHVNRISDFAKGYICKKFVAPAMSEDDSSHSSEISSKSMSFVPREEVVVICPTIAGHSGGPCVNNDGKVVGILSRADPGERQRCYLVPSSELKNLIKKAKKHFMRPSVGMTL